MAVTRVDTTTRRGEVIRRVEYDLAAGTRTITAEGAARPIVEPIPDEIREQIEQDEAEKVQRQKLESVPDTSGVANIKATARRFGLRSDQTMLAIIEYLIDNDAPDDVRSL